MTVTTERKRSTVGPRVLDVLETDQGWMTADTITVELKARFGEGTLDSVRQALYRLRRQGRVTYRAYGEQTSFDSVDDFMLAEWKWVGDAAR